MKRGCSMKKLILFLILILLPQYGNSATITLNSEALFTTGGTFSDTQTTASGVKLRQEDRTSDISHTIGGTYSDDLTDVPPGTTFHGSRKKISGAAPPTGFGATYNRFDWVSKGCEVQPTSLTIWYKVPYHCWTYYSGYYVFQTNIGAHRDGYDTSPLAAVPAGTHVIGSFSFDVHDFYPGHLGAMGYLTGLMGAPPAPVEMYLKPIKFVPENNVWEKYTKIYDWPNQRFTIQVNDTVPFGSTISSIAIGVLTCENFDYIILDTSVGWIGFWNNPASSFTNPTSSYGYSTDTISYINYFWEMYDALNTQKTQSIGNLTELAATDLCRFWLHEGTYTQDWDLSSAESTITSATLNWTPSVTTDSTFTTMYGRSIPYDNSANASASSSTNGAAANACDGDDTTYWSPSGTTGDWVYDFGVSGRKITKCEISSGLVSDTLFVPSTIDSTRALTAGSIQGSNDNSNWTTLKPFTVTDRSLHLTFNLTWTNTTSYQYYRVHCTTGGSSGLRINNITMRESGSTYNSSTATSLACEYQISTNSGSSYGSWQTITSGGSINGLSAGISRNYLRVRTRWTYGTENPQYQAIISSASLSTNGTEDPYLPTANFTASSTSGTTSTTFTFTDSSINSPNTWYWTFGDTTTSTLQNPTHTYAAAGTYTVTMTAYNAYGSNTQTRTDYITVTGGGGSAPVSNFSAAPNTGTAPLTVNFTDLSLNTPTSWDWNWGDSTTHGTTQNPTHIYTASGLYSVTLTATNSIGSNSITQSNCISIGVPGDPVSVMFGGSRIQNGRGQ